MAYWLTALRQAAKLGFRGWLRRSGLRARRKWLVTVPIRKGCWSCAMATVGVQYMPGTPCKPYVGSGCLSVSQVSPQDENGADCRPDPEAQSQKATWHPAPKSHALNWPPSSRAGQRLFRGLPRLLHEEPSGGTQGSSTKMTCFPFAQEVKARKLRPSRQPWSTLLGLKCFKRTYTLQALSPLCDGIATGSLQV